MTQPTTESRLDRLEAIAETVLLAIQQQQQQTQTNQAELQSTQTEMRQSIEDVVRMIATLAESADEDRKLIIGMQTSIVGMQNSITGMQTENRRILDHLLNDRSDS
jgi:prophage DNA circulation protein